jgi:nicotinic acid mononucleotide adenylyltransferase
MAAAAAAGMDLSPFTHIAWMGGSYSPPTKAHFNVAMTVGKFLSSSGGNIAVLIVPVASAYNKASVVESCITSTDRFALVKAMVDELNANASKPANVSFILSDHEIAKPIHTATIDSLEYVKTLAPGAEIFVAQGQDNILAILKRGWVRSDELLQKYSFLMYPRGEGLTDKDMRAALASVSSKGFSPITGDAAGIILGKIYVLGVEFNDDTSSSAVRQSIVDNTDVYKSMMTPSVLATMEMLNTSRTSPPLYTAGCGTVPTVTTDAGGAGAGAAAASTRKFGGARRRKHRATRRKSSRRTRQQRRR